MHANVQQLVQALDQLPVQLQNRYIELFLSLLDQTKSESPTPQLSAWDQVESLAQSSTYTKEKARQHLNWIEAGYDD